MNPTSNCICKHSEESHYSLNGMGSGCIACDCPVFRPAPKPEARMEEPNYAKNVVENNLNKFLDERQQGKKCPYHPSAVHRPEHESGCATNKGFKQCDCSAAPQKENKWEEEFDENFNGDWCLMHCVDTNKKDLAPIIKSFIHSLMREAEEKIRKQSQRQILDLTDEIVKTHAAALKKVEEEIIPQHNARILNQFQLQGTPDMPFIAYDERVCLAPAMETATKETLFTLKEKSQQ